MAIRDRNMDWMRRCYRIPYQLFGWEPSHTHEYTTHTGTGTTESAESLTGMESSAGNIAEISSFGVGGVTLAQGDAHSCIDLHTPIHADPQKEIGARVLFTVNEASPSATDYVHFTVTYKQFDQDEALAAASTALDTTIARCTPGVTSGYQLHATARGVIDADTFNFDYRSGGLIWKVAATTVSGYAADKVTLLALEIDYLPQVCASAEEAFDDLAGRSASS